MVESDAGPRGSVFSLSLRTSFACGDRASCTLVRPLLVLLTLPVTVLTLGLFLFVINALMFWAAASVLDGFNVEGFGAALVGSLLYSLASVVIDVAVERLFGRMPE